MSYGDYPDLSSVRRVLVIKLRHLGDVLLTTPLISVLKTRMPQASIDAYVNAECKPLLEYHPSVSKIFCYDRALKRERWTRRVFEEWALLKAIRRESYDLVLNLTEGDRGALVTRFSGASIRVGMDRRRLYTHIAKSCPAPRHTVERQLDVARRIGIFPSEEEKELMLSIPERVQERARRLVPWDRFVLIHPSSRWRFKCVPVKTMHDVAARLIQRGEKVVFTSGSDSAERAMIAEIVNGLPESACLSLAGVLSVLELAALIEQCAVLLCVDSLPHHLASALKKAVVVLFGPTSEVTWGPWRNPQARVVCSDQSCRPCYLDGCGGGKVSDCLHKLSVERILSEFEIMTKVGDSSLRVVH